MGPLGELVLYLALAASAGFVVGFLVRGAVREAEWRRRERELRERLDTVERGGAGCEASLATARAELEEARTKHDALRAELRKARAGRRELEAFREQAREREEKGMQLDFLVQSMLADREARITELEERVARAAPAAAGARRSPPSAEGDPRQGVLFPELGTADAESGGSVSAPTRNSARS